MQILENHKLYRNVSQLVCNDMAASWTRYTDFAKLFYTFRDFYKFGR